MKALRLLNSSCRLRLLHGVAATPLFLGLMSSPAFAQDAVQAQPSSVPSGAPAPAAATADESVATPADADGQTSGSVASRGQIADIVVTGSRIKRNGGQSPTPETVITSADIKVAAPANIADYVNDLPQLAGSSTPRNNPSSVSSGSSGSNFLNLRGLGVNRTLVLLDGRRVVGSGATGRVDINTLPSALISRIDVVTGGASAAYGSDAVAGVVNFVLDTKFTGLKLEAMNGVTTYGDNYRRSVEAAGGLAFADGRGHVIASATWSKNDGVLQAQSRPWFNGAKTIPNPAYTATNAEPLLIQPTNANTGNASLGGLITTGVLAGTQFGQGGSISQRVFGTPAGMYSIGGELQDMAAYQTLDIPVEQFTAFGRVSYDLSDAVEIFGEASYGKATVTNLSAFNWRFGDITVSADNAYLPTELRTRLAAAGQTSFRFGTFNGDIGQWRVRNERELQRYVAGANFKLGAGWTADFYGTYGRVDAHTAVSGLINKAHYASAIDAVVNPATNGIVCRSTLTNPANGCVPFNLFGIGVNTPEALAYATGTSQLDSKIQQTVVSGSAQGELFSTWAGPVSVAFGAEYRKEQVSGVADPVSLVNGYFAANYKPTNGQYEVKEGFVEADIPLAKDLPFLYSLNLNAAARYTHYSTSGGVKTWKVGGTWNPIHDLRFRATRSRDIRAPNIGDLFQGGVVSTGNTVLDRGTSTGGILVTTVGNPALKPENADTTTVGVVYTPSWLPGLSISVDYYNVKISDAILTLLAQDTVNRCNGGNTVYCSFVTRTNGTITSLTLTPTNVAQEVAKGLDIEASYQHRFASDAQLTLRALATYVDQRSIDDGLTINYQQGENSPDNISGSIARWRVISSAGISAGPFSGVITGRYVSPGKFDNAYTSKQLANNRIAGATYFDLSLTAKFPAMSGDGEIFFNVDNLFNKDPVIIPQQSQPFYQAPVNSLLYDTLGREFRVGVRLKF
ncbi:TonB-dependent receptor [Sphingobium terrigena]|uniref:TonB-dependent receptor n=1 Tax=Sphingobium terrigena TaxID=2304063 RepID=A0A418YXR9_9SPHN|nr:TonB-dependent receptor [Sphingobium terrigena]RJG57663.1 TonB-dependent receptor [Sphingobium terrigena]